jgi:ketosteroid isomerase-like protein
MSQEENIEVARRSFVGWNEGGVQGSRDVGWTDDAEFHDPPSLPGAAVYRGADAVAARLEELTDLLAAPAVDRQLGDLPGQLELLDAIAVGEDEVLMITQVHGEGGSSGIPVEQQMSLLMQITDGKVSRWRWFMSVEEGRAAAGLSG